MAFYVGQKVVCVDASRAPLLEKNKVYKITSIQLPYLRVDCPPDGVTGTESDRGYQQWRFRPVVEPNTDISIFTAMLDPARIEEKKREIA